MEKGDKAEAEKVFVFNRPTRDLDEYQKLLEIASRLTPYGKVCVGIGDLAEKSWHDVPPFRSPWHEYGSYIPTLHKVFPHPKIEPFMPADSVRKNQNLMKSKAEMLDKEGLGGFYRGSDPFFLPLPFFREYPELRGPRVDHPRRGTQAEFTYCIDIPEGREMLEWMMGELKKAVPMLGVYQFNTNDVGSGLCWSDYLYTGKNGPRPCQLRSMGDRLRDLFQTIHNGAINNGGDVDVHFTHNMHLHEYDQVKPLLPPHTYLRANFRSDPTSVHTGNPMVDPARGLIDPYAVISAAERFSKPSVRTCFFDFRYGHARAGGLLSTADKVINLFKDCLDNPTDGLMSRLEKLKEVSAKWAGENNAEKIMETLYGMNQSFGGTRKYSPQGEGVSVRHITRPLVVKPDLLTKEEESYFLPHVFNVSEEEARDDYVDVHGGRLNTDACKGDWFWDSGLQGALAGLKGAAQTLESIEDAPEADLLKRMATALKMYVSFVLSSNNFYYGQVFRDRHKEALAAEEPISQPKERNLSGVSDYTQWYEVATDELNNAEELLRLLKNGEELISNAASLKEEDTFILGPNIVENIEQKIKIMLDRWDDVGKYLVSPMK